MASNNRFKSAYQIEKEAKQYAVITNLVAILLSGLLIVAGWYLATRFPSIMLPSMVLTGMAVALVIGLLYELNLTIGLWLAFMGVLILFVTLQAYVTILTGNVTLSATAELFMQPDHILSFLEWIAKVGLQLSSLVLTLAPVAILSKSK